MRFTLGKQERLKSKTLIEKLYKEGSAVKVFPLRMVFLQETHSSNFPAQVGVSVPKRIFKKAVSRNRIKRRLRETYRKQKYMVYTSLEKPYVFMISYIGRDELSYEALEVKMNALLTSFLNEVKKRDTNEKK